MKQPCSSCAFAKGCAANLEPYNRVRSEICAQAAIPFYCHDTFDWKNTDPDKMTRDEVVALRRNMNICQGWRRRVRQLASRGHFKNAGVREIRRLLGHRALAILQTAIRSSGEEKTRHYNDLDDTIRMLAS